MAEAAAQKTTEVPTADTTAACCTPELSPLTNDFLTALASETRQQIMRLFAQGAELSVGEVAERAGLSQPAASQQLAVLRRGGVVTSRRDGRTVLYRGDKARTAEALKGLLAYLEYCC